MALDPKKGVGCSDTCHNITLQNLGVTWYYNWNNYTNQTTSIQFVPMCFSGRRVATMTGGPNYLLGFNQPDHSKQANMAIETAYNYWSTLVALTDKIASPATAENPAKIGSWL